MSAKTLYVDAHDGAFFEVDREMRRAQQVWRKLVELRVVADQQQLVFVSMSPDFFPDLFVGGARGERLGTQDLTGVAEHGFGDGSGIDGTLQLACQDQSGLYTRF